MRNIITVLALALTIIACSKPTIDDEFIAPPVETVEPVETVDPVEPTVTTTTTTEVETPNWITVVNGHLGTVSATTRDKNVIFEISSSANWELRVNDAKYDNFNGEFVDIEPHEDIVVSFVDGPLQIEHDVNGVTVVQRWDISFNYPNYSRDFVLNTVTIAREQIVASNAEEMLVNFDNMTVELFADNTGALGTAGGDAIQINIYDSSFTVEYMAGVVIHEVAHLYDGTEHNGNAGLEIGWDDRNFSFPNLYYNTNPAEYFACATTAYVGGAGAHHNIARENYYHEVTVPLLNTEFNN